MRCRERRDTGRPGMDLCPLLALPALRGALRTGCVRREDRAEHHQLMRAVPGSGRHRTHSDGTRIWPNLRKVRAATVMELRRWVRRLGKP
jgi:hypothetical protein